MPDWGPTDCLQYSTYIIYEKGFLTVKVDAKSTWLQIHACGTPGYDQHGIIIYKYNNKPI